MKNNFLTFKYFNVHYSIILNFDLIMTSIQLPFKTESLNYILFVKSIQC